MATKERASNIELLRLLSAIGVVIVHYIYPHAVSGIKETAMGGGIFISY